MGWAVLTKPRPYITPAFIVKPDLIYSYKGRERQSNQRTSGVCGLAARYLVS